MTLRSAPIFVGGDHRSGTTLVSLILDAHPDLVVGPEIDFLEPLDLGPHLRECHSLLVDDDPRVRGEGVWTADPELQRGVQMIRQCQRFGVEPADLLALLEVHEPLLVGEADPGAWDFTCRARVIDAIGEHRRGIGGAARWGIKIQRQIVRVADFAAAWPAAQFVHVVRDGRDVAASHLRGGHDWAYQTIEAAARGWCAVAGTTVPRGLTARVAVLRYEDLVTDTTATLIALLAFLGLPWHDDLLHHDDVAHSLISQQFGHPSAAAAAEAVNGRALGRFRRDLDAADVAAFERIAADVLTRWGYPLSGVGQVRA